MTPTLKPGDWLWIAPSSPHIPNENALVLVRDPSDQSRLLVKRVRSRGNATFSVGSDNPTSGRDSRHFGSLAPELLHGYVVGYIDTVSLRRSHWIR